MTTTATPGAGGKASATALGRAIAADWIRLWRLRSTWWALLAGTITALGMGAVFGHEFHTRPTPVWRAGEFAIIPCQFAVLVAVTVFVTSEYATGAIRSTLQWIPRRGVLLLARTFVSAGVAAVAGALLAGAADLTAWLWLGANAEVVAGDIATSLLAVATAVGAGALLATGLGMLLRSTAGTLTAVFLLLLLLPVMLSVFGVDFDAPWLTTVARHLPGFAAASLLRAHEIDMSALTTTVVLAGWTATATALGTWALLRRDAV